MNLFNYIVRDSNLRYMGGFPTLREADEFIALTSPLLPYYDIIDAQGRLLIRVKITRWVTRRPTRERYDEADSLLSGVQFEAMCEASDDVMIAPGHPQACVECGGVVQHLDGCPTKAPPRGIDYSLDVRIGTVERVVTFSNRYTGTEIACLDYKAVTGNECFLQATLTRHSPESSKIVASAILTTMKED
jgi:hypothetical protein